MSTLKTHKNSRMVTAVALCKCQHGVVLKKKFQCLKSSPATFFGRANERVELDKQVSALYGAETAADLQFYLGMA